MKRLWIIKGETQTHYNIYTRNKRKRKTFTRHLKRNNNTYINNMQFIKERLRRYR